MTGNTQHSSSTRITVAGMFMYMFILQIGTTSHKTALLKFIALYCRYYGNSVESFWSFLRVLLRVHRALWSNCSYDRQVGPKHFISWRLKHLSCRTQTSSHTAPDRQDQIQLIRSRTVLIWYLQLASVSVSKHSPISRLCGRSQISVSVVSLSESQQSWKLPQAFSF